METVADISHKVLKAFAISEKVKKHWKLPYEIAIGGQKYEESSNVLRIQDTFENVWAFRVDSKGSRGDGTSGPHINLNEQLSGVPDAHIPISNTSLGGAKFVNDAAWFLQKVGTVVQCIVVVKDVYDVGKTWNEDGFEEAGKKFGKKVAGYAGGFAGARLGGIAGVKLGAMIGTFFGGPVGTVIGATAGGIVGSFVGSLAGIYMAEWVAEKVEKKVTEVVKKVAEKVTEVAKKVGGAVTSFCKKLFSWW